MVHGKNRIPYRIDRRLTGLADLNMVPLSRSGCSLSLKTHNMGNPGQEHAQAALRTKNESHGMKGKTRRIGLGLLSLMVVFMFAAGACGNSSTITLTWAARRDGRTLGTRC